MSFQKEIQLKKKILDKTEKKKKENKKSINLSGIGTFRCTICAPHLGYLNLIISLYHGLVTPLSPHQDHQLVVQLYAKIKRLFF